jgi:hypothetical protein
VRGSHIQNKPLSIVTGSRTGTVSVSKKILVFAKDGIYALLLLYIFYQADQNVPQGLFRVRVYQEKIYVGK